jgi:two-component system OmpR family sensor kinase
MAVLELRIRELTSENQQLAEAIAARDTFLAAAAHELRNPMTPIRGRVELLRRIVAKPDPEPAQIARGLEQIELLIEQYVKRATTLLDISRITSGKLHLAPAPVALAPIARTVIENFRPVADHAAVRIELTVTGDEPTVLGDGLAVEQIFDNLISNAVKYGAGSPVEVTIAADSRQRAATVRVRDHGPGISPADRARIFERFERAVLPGHHSGGFGVGLWLVRQLTEAMGGSIDVAGAPGEGSTFTITLPLHSPQERR